MTTYTYTVYDNKTDELIILDGTSKECAKALGITLDSFHAYLCKSKKGIIRWTIITTKHKNPRIKQVQRLRNKGYSLGQIALKLKMSSRLVWYYLKKSEAGGSI